jgi:hypothetical protein
MAAIGTKQPVDREEWILYRGIARRPVKAIGHCSLEGSTIKAARLFLDGSMSNEQ